MSHLGGCGASGVLGFTSLLPVSPDWSKEMGPACPFWGCRLLPDGCNPPERRSRPSLHLCWLLIELILGAVLSQLFLNFLRGKESTFTPAEGRHDRHQIQTSLTVRDRRLTKSSTERGLCGAERLTDHDVCCPRGDWVCSPCQPAFSTWNL